MIQTEQLAAALERLEAPDREVLDFSLRRRVPDEALARLYDCDTKEIARRRAGAIERLADAMGARGGEDLGAILKGLLDPGTWSAAEARRAVPEAPTIESSPGDAADRSLPKPVLEMLEEAERKERPRRRRVPRIVAAALVGAALLVAAGVVAASTLVDRGGGRETRRAATETRPFEPQRSGPIGNPFPSDPKSASDYATAYVPHTTVLYDSPGGSRMLRIAGRTEWRSPRVLGVVEQRGRWLGVQVPELKNGVVGWIPQEAARIGSVPYRIDADLSRRTLWVNRNGHELKRMKIAVGGPGHPTPRGRFSVTDKLRVTDPGSPYGCCVLALTGHQTHLPRDWPGGDRLAIHATTDTATIGKAVSLGCMRVTSSQARWLIRTVPLGTPVIVRR